jgi:hypothetical protein
LDDQLLLRIQLTSVSLTLSLAQPSANQPPRRSPLPPGVKVLKGFDFHDQPGEISFVDTQVRHSGKENHKENRC